MKKLFATLTGFIVLLMSFTSCEAKMNYVKVANKDLEYSVYIHEKLTFKKAQNNKHVRAFISCSGTYVDKDKVLTAGHCFNHNDFDIDSVWVLGIDGHSHLAQITEVDVKHDLALLTIPNMNHSYVKLGKQPKVGDEILNIGSPLGLKFLVSNGIVSALNIGAEEIGLKSHYTVTNGMCNPGSSGGGMFNKKGQLVGVNTMIAASMEGGWEGITFSVSMQDINTFLGRK